MTPVRQAPNSGLVRSRMKVFSAGLLVLAFASGCQSKKPAENASSFSGNPTVEGASAPVTGVTSEVAVGANPQAEAPGAESKKSEAPLASADAAAAPAEVQKKVEPAPECVTVTFRHRSTPKHALGEECVLHENRIELPQSLRDPRFTSFCVRVDGAAVHATRRKNQFILAATRKPTSVITVRGCPSDKACAQDCTPARDAFMDGLVGEAGEAAGAGWKGEADAVAALDPAVKRELAALDEESVSDAWDSGADAPAVSACGRARVANR